MNKNTNHLLQTTTVVWDFTPLYDSIDDPNIEKDKKKTQQRAEEFSQAYRHNISTGDYQPNFLRTALEEYDSLSQLLYKIANFASLNFDIHIEETSYRAFQTKVEEFASSISEQVTFFDLELQQIPDSLFEELIKSSDLQPFRHYLKKIRIFTPYTLSEKEEILLQKKSQTGMSAFADLFSELISTQEFSLEIDGEAVSLPFDAVLQTALQHPHRETRKQAHQALTERLEELSIPLRFIFNIRARETHISNEIRNYPYLMAYRDLSNEIDQSVTETLINSVQNAYQVPQKYFTLKQRLLTYDQLHEYDILAPLDEIDETIPFPAAKEIVLESFGEFDGRFSDIASKFFTHNWIHAPIQKGKRTGAYCSYGTKNIPPYILLNYQGKPRDVMTLAHELGHGIHHYLYNQNQPFIAAHPPLTTAETASTFGEMLVFNQLLQKADTQTKITLLASKVEETFLTVYRQIAMVSFERRFHELRAERGQLDTNELNQLWLDEFRKLYGESVTVTDQYGYWWSYIPHMINTPFYVYAYAFGELLSLSLYGLYKSGMKNFQDTYLEMLSKGGSVSPRELLQPFGIDFTKPDFWKQGIGIIEEMVRGFEELIKETARK